MRKGGKKNTDSTESKDFCVVEMACKYKIVFVRHGESVWNKENKFTGWTDVDLSENGVTEAKRAGNETDLIG